MTRTVRRVLAVLVPQLPLAAAAQILVLLGLVDVAPRWAWLLAAAAATVVLAAPVAERAGAQPPLTATNLPGFADPLRPPRPRLVRWGTGVVLAALALSAGFGSVPATVVVVLLAALALIVAVAVGWLRLRGRSAERARVTEALTRYGPRFAVYTGRRNDASYQLRMWLPVLEKLGVPYLVVVRHPAAVAMAASVTRAPVVCCPSASDLDCVVVESLAAAFYVNTVAENASFVLYRSMTHVYLGHGDSDKELSAHPAHAMFDKIFVAGRAARQRYPRNGVDIPEDKFVVVGRPQLAAAQRASRSVADADPPRVLVAPTWRGYNSRTTLSSLAVAPQLVQALIAAGAEVIFRPHPFSWLGRAERASVRAVDDLLRSDRGTSGRNHLLATEQRGSDIATVFNASDAMITDVGSVLVDYFVTAKPYAVMLPSDADEASARQRFPTLEAAYLLPRPALGSPGGSAAAAVLRELLIEDPRASQRAATAAHYLGETPGDERPFLDEVTSLLRRQSPGAG